MLARQMITFRKVQGDPAEALEHPPGACERLELLSVPSLVKGKDVPGHQEGQGRWVQGSSGEHCVSPPAAWLWRGPKASDSEPPELREIGKV